MRHSNEPLEEALLQNKSKTLGLKIHSLSLSRIKTTGVVIRREETDTGRTARVDDEQRESLESTSSGGSSKLTGEAQTASRRASFVEKTSLCAKSSIWYAE